MIWNYRVKTILPIKITIFKKKTSGKNLAVSKAKKIVSLKEDNIQSPSFIIDIFSCNEIIQN